MLVCVAQDKLPVAGEQYRTLVVKEHLYGIAVLAEVRVCRYRAVPAFRKDAVAGKKYAAQPERGEETNSIRAVSRCVKDLDIEFSNPQSVTVP
jgi:hypothetical protein